VRRGLSVWFTLLVALAAPAHAQWLNQPTPNIPRTADGKPDLAAPPARAADGHPELSGIWTNRGIAYAPPDNVLTPAAKELVRAREENYFKDRPFFQCLPSGPEVKVGSKRFNQSPTLITIMYEDLSYRLIFMDGRKLERDPARTWMGYSVGRWEGDTLVVDSFGFNDRSWLDARGLPHTEDLRLTERYRRSTVGRIEVEVTATDPNLYTAPLTVSYAMTLQPDTEMIEAVCESEQEHWVGRQSDIEHGAVTVVAEILARYVGVYSGLWVDRPRTVQVKLVDGTLYVSGLVGDTVRLVPHSDTYFMSTDGLMNRPGNPGDSGL